MIFGFLLKKKMLTPLEPGDMIEIAIPGEEQDRVLYAKVVKVSKKKNIFVNFASEDKGNGLVIGTEGSITALKPAGLIRFSTRFLHQKEDTFIFSPPETVLTRKISPVFKILAFKIDLPVEYRGMATSHVQKGTVAEFSCEVISLVANLPIPAATSLNLELKLPQKEDTLHVRGKVISCDRYSKDPKKHLVRVSLDECKEKDKESILWFALISNWGEQS